RNCETAALPALDTLIIHVNDPDENVRLMSAQAIARLGPAAVSAVPALVRAARVEGQHVHVLRSVADALGALGSEASSALPVLRELERIPRVRWSAAAAIARIENAH